MVVVEVVMAEEKQEAGSRQYRKFETCPLRMREGARLLRIASGLCCPALGPTKLPFCSNRPTACTNANPSRHHHTHTPLRHGCAPSPCYHRPQIVRTRRSFAATEVLSSVITSSLSLAVTKKCRRLLSMLRLLLL